jgi:hypothetical protein
VEVCPPLLRCPRGSVIVTMRDHRTFLRSIDNPHRTAYRYKIKPLIHLDGILTRHNKWVTFRSRRSCLNTFSLILQRSLIYSSEHSEIRSVRDHHDGVADLNGPKKFPRR